MTPGPNTLKSDDVETGEDDMGTPGGLRGSLLCEELLDLQKDQWFRPYWSVSFTKYLREEV